MNLVFDFGEVLFRWQPVELIQAQFADRLPTHEAARELAGQVFLHRDWLEFDRGALDLSEVVQRTAARLALPAQDLHAMLATVGERLAPVAGTLELLARLRARREQRADLRLYYLSNMPLPYARQLQARHDFLGWFDGGIFSGDVRLIKPDPGIYRLLAGRHALQPARTLFIDDVQANVQAAIDQGWQGLRFDGPATLARHLHGLGLLA